MKSRVLGELKSVDYDPDFFESEPYPIPYFDKEKLKVLFIDALHEPYLLGAEETIDNFLKLTSKDRKLNSQLVYNYYSEILKFGYTEDSKIINIEEIWNFVYPNEIIIHWEEDDQFYLIVSCGCQWEKEHGLQLVFKNGIKLIKASGHDGDFVNE